MIPHIFRNYVAGFLAPSNIIFILLIVATILLWKNRANLAKKLLIVISSLYFIFSLGITRYIAYSLIEYPAQKIPTEYDFVVVLGAAGYPHSDHPSSSKLSSHLLSRMDHGLYLARQNPNSKLIVTGSGADEVAEARIMSDYALEMGFPHDRIIVDPLSKNTFDHARLLKPIVENKKFVVVTSAYHMGRALKNFKFFGLEGIPSPTDYVNKNGITVDTFMIRASNLAFTDRWFTEMLSRSWAEVRFLIEK